jgi:hypothetical protein
VDISWTPLKLWDLFFLNSPDTIDGPKDVLRDNILDIPNVLQKWSAMALTDEPYPTGEHRVEAYWRSLIGDISENGPEKGTDHTAFLYRHWRNTFRHAESGFYSVPEEMAEMLGGQRSRAVAILYRMHDPEFKAFHARVLSTATGNSL